MAKGTCTRRFRGAAAKAGPVAFAGDAAVTLVRRLSRHCWVVPIGIILGCTGGTSPQLPAPSITTDAPLPSGTRAQSYTQTIVATGGDGTNYSWSVVAGALPPGLALSTGGVVSGTPSAAGEFSFTIQVSSGGQTANKPFSLTIDQPAMTITTTALPNGTVSIAYSQSIAADGGSGAGYTWSIVAGALPAGLTIAMTGTPNTTLSGTPSTSGTFNFTVRVGDSSGGFATRALSIVVN